MSLLTEVQFNLLRLVIFIWDFVTRPIYYLIFKPWEKQKAFKQVRSRLLERKESELTLEGINSNAFDQDVFLNDDSTLDRAFDFVFEKFRHKNCLGSRQFIREERELTQDGKTLTKVVQGPYEWKSYLEVENRVTSFGKGLRILGLQPRAKIAIYADTQPNWFTAAIACFKFNFPLVTIYTNLGEAGVTYSICQSEVEFVMVSQELLGKFLGFIHEMPQIRTVIVFEEPHKGPISSSIEGTVCKIIAFEEVLKLGNLSENQNASPVPEDIAIIMYTSGSTGNPKGVILTHHNMVTGLKSLLIVAIYSLREIQPDETYIAYLPLAHVLELLAECTVILLGIPVGYSSPMTLMDSSPKIRKFDQGDISVLRPTIFCAVPLVLDRIYKGLNKKIRESGEFQSKLVNFLITYRAKWIEKGYDTPIANTLVFNKIKSVVGGKVRMMLCGGAPLSQEAHKFIRTCLCVTLHQGYGLTETCGAACVTDVMDISTGRVGAPLQGTQIKLVDWAEGGYFINDKVGPRGEIIIGGSIIAKGYYNMPEQTESDFYEENGRRWLRTGDIGQIMLDDGTLKIIDRKKDIVKLQMGEYVSLNKVESALKLHEIVETVFVSARSSEQTTVAIVVPDKAHLEKIANKLNKHRLDKTTLCKDPAVTREVLNVLSSHGASMKLEKFEIPKAITLAEETWTPDSGLVTAAMKLKRPALESFYRNQIDLMYLSLKEDFTLKPKMSSNRVSPA